MFFNKIHKRINIVLTVFLFFFVLIVFKVFYIQVIDYKKLSSLADKLWNRNLPIEANRGIIFDRNGEILADNITTSSLILIPNQIKEKEKTAKILSDILNSDYNDMLVHVNKKSSLERVHPEGRRLSYKIADKISDLNLEGVNLVKETKRNYLKNGLLSHTIGFVGIDNQGLSGLELEYNEYLTGEYGAIKYMSDAKGNNLNNSSYYEQPQNGVNMTLTIDYELQKSLERELDNAQLRYNPDHILGIAMNPKTGEILAIASRPDFDQSNYQDYSIEDINRNLPIWMTYEPGSTFKIITLAASLEEKKVDLENDRFYDSGSVNVDGSRIKCWKAGGHGEQTFLEVVQNSCNPGFVELGQRLGKEKLFSYIDAFGFGKKTGIDLNGESKGILFNVNKVGAVELATTSFGQGVSVTPIQQISAVSAAINGGILYKPYIVKSLNEPSTNSVVKYNQPKVIKKVISNNTSKKIKDALEHVVALGSGRNAYIEDYRIGGKTGTAQKVENGKYMIGNYITSFIGFLPANDPKIVLYIAVDNAKGITQYGGTIAAPIAKNIFNDAINIFNIKKDKTIPKIYNYADIPSSYVPKVTNLKLKDALNKLKEFKVEIIGEGDKVIYQSPINGSLLKNGDIVKLMLGN